MAATREIYIDRQSATIAETIGIPAQLISQGPPIGRRGLFALALAPILAATLDGCASPDAAPAVAAVPPGLPATPADPAATSMADKIKLVSDTVGVTLPKLGLDGGKLAAGADIVSQLAALADKLGAGNGGSLASAATFAVGQISKLAPIAGIVGGPYGMIISAAVAMGPAILQLAGIHARQAPGAMPPAEAERVLRHARGY